jgi:hypothetical protein
MKFKKHVQSEWNIDQVEYISAGNCSGSSFYNVVSTQEDIGKVVFTEEKTDGKIAYAVTDTQYKGYWEFNNGQINEFVYEISGKLYGGSQLTIFDSQFVGLSIEILTSKNLILTINDYNGDCYYSAVRYVLSK